MSTQANGAAPPDHPLGQDMMAQDIDVHSSSPDAIMTDADVDPNVDVDAASTPMGLRSPPDSDKALNPDEASDSELSDLDDDVADKLDQDLTFDLDSTTTNLSDSKTENQQPGPTVSHEHDKPATAATVENTTRIKEEQQEGERKQSQQPEAGAASANTPMSPSEEDIGEILPDRFENNVPVFKPTMKQFQDFKLFMEKVDKYGMKSGIIKIIPPDEWKSSLPPLDELVKQVRVREPIKQEIMGQNGTYRQVNILHQRSYNLPQWRKLCEQSEHQPPARRGERRANAEKDKPAARSRAAANATTSNKTTTSTHSGRGGRRKGRVTRGSAKAATDETDDPPITPVSPPPEEEDKPVKSIEEDNEEDCEEEESAPKVGRMGFSRQGKPKMQSTSARRKYIRREGSAMIDEAAFKDWDYRMDVSEFTPERCEELERIYWKTLTYAPPLYGADLPGTLFDEATENWNLNKLPNLLDVLGTKVPGVNTAYLYLGMWKATFAWHLEDVDLYSINFLHFGAPKQWYSISQADARRFEAAMKNIWPTDAKACDQFLRHKSFLISPSHLKQHYGITVNKVVSYPGEFVVTYPYGYHSGYNLGYNCAEAVNFALDSWLPMGKIAKKCQCAQAQDSVWVDVYEIERKLRGESTEYEVTEDEDEEDEDSDESDQDTGLPSPPSGLDQRGAKRVRTAGQRRKREANIKSGPGKAKRSRYRLKAPAEPPCCLCPNDIPGAEIMPTDDGRKAHRMCALYLPETYIETVDDQEIIANVAGIDKARLELKCLYCRSKKGACFQCSQKKCPRAYHATCAAAAGVFVEEGDVPVIGEDGTEYKEQAFEFSCRFHRVKRDRKTEGSILEDDPVVRKTAESLKKNDICQIQYYQGNIFAGVVVENMHDEETLLLDVIPSGDRIQVEWKWLLVADPSEYRLPKASANAIPMPTSKKAKQEINAKRPIEEIPRKGDELCDGFVWAEFHTGEPERNKEQVKIDLHKENQVWHYLGSTSTEARAQYTENPSRKKHNSKSNFLDTIPKPPPGYGAPVAAAPRKSISVPYPTQQQTFAVSPASSSSMASTSLASKQDKPYVYKPRKPVQPQTQFSVQYTSHMFMPAPPLPSPSYMPQQNHPFYQAQLRPNVPQTVHPSQVFSSHQQHQPMQFDNQRRMSQPIQPFHQQQMSPQHFAPQHQMPQQMPQHQFQPQHQPQQHQFQHFQPPHPQQQYQQQQAPQQQHQQQPQQQQQQSQQQHQHYIPSNYPQTPVPLPPQAFQFQQQTPVPLPQQVQAQPPQQKTPAPLPPPVQAQPQPPQQQQPVQPIRQTPVPVPQVPLPPARSTQSPPQQQQPPQQAEDEKAQQPQPTADEARPASPPQPLPKPKPFKVYKASQFKKLKLPEKKPGGKKELPDAFASSRFSFAGIDRIHELPGCQWPPKTAISGPEIQYRPRVWSPLGDEGPKPAPMTSSLLKRPEDEQRPSMKYDFFRKFNNTDPLKNVSPYKPAVTELDETTGKQRLVQAEFTEYYSANFTKFMKNAQEALTRKNESEPNSRPATSHAHSRNASSASVQQKESQPQQSSVNGQPTRQPRVQPQYNYNQHEAGFGGSPFSSHSVPGPVMVGQAFVQQSGSHQQYQGQWQQQYQNQGSHNTWMGSPQMVGSPQPQMFSPQPAQQGHHHHLPQQAQQQQQQNAQNQQPPPPQPAKPQFTKQSHSPIPLPPYVQKMAQAKPSPLSQPPQTVQSQPQKKRQRKTAHQASGQTISPNQLSVNTGASSSTQGQPQKTQSNNPWTNANNVNLQFPTVTSQPPAPAPPAAPAQPQSQSTSSDNATAPADASTAQQDPAEEEAQHEETSYFNEAQVEGLQTPPLNPQSSLSSTDVSPDQSYFPSLSAPPPTPLTGIQNHGNFAFSTSMLGPIGTTFNPSAAFNINSLSMSSGIGGLGALGTLGGLLGGIESGASANASAWSGRARGLSRSGDNVFMGSTSVIDEEGEDGSGSGGGGGSGSRGGGQGGGGGGGGGGGLSSSDMLEKIFSNLHRLGGD